jgi:hypothetical protein
VTTSIRTAPAVPVSGAAGASRVEMSVTIFTLQKETQNFSMTLLGMSVLGGG